MRAYDIIRRWIRRKPISVLVKIYKPIDDMWNNEPLDLTMQFIQLMKRYDKNYHVKAVHQHGVFPVLDADRQYTPESYIEVLKDSSKAIREKSGALAIIDYRRVIEPGCDEIWLFGGPYFGFYESRMIGKGAYWLNSPPLEMPMKPVIVMGFNYERDLREMVHSYCHRIESIMVHVTKSSYIYRTYSNEWKNPQCDWDRWVEQNGNTHNKRGEPPYSQDEFEWLKKFRWWHMV